MKLTTKSRYGVRALFDISYHAGGLPAQIKNISERQCISPRYLEQIFLKLKKAGILGSRRGPKGGYYLLKNPDEITLYDIIAAAEGPIELVFCVRDEESKAASKTKSKAKKASVCELKDKCVATTVWKEMGEKIAEAFKGTTIQDLCDRAESLGIERQFDSRFMYYI